MTKYNSGLYFISAVGSISDYLIMMECGLSDVRRNVEINLLFISPSPANTDHVAICQSASTPPTFLVSIEEREIVGLSAMSNSRLQGYLVKKNRKLQESPASKILVRIVCSQIDNMFLEFCCTKEEINQKVAFSEKIYFHPEQIERFLAFLFIFGFEVIKSILISQNYTAAVMLP